MDVLESGDGIADRDGIGEPLREVRDAVVLQREVGGADPSAAIAGIGWRRITELRVEDRNIAEEGKPLEEAASRTLRIADEEVVGQWLVQGKVGAVLRVRRLKLLATVAPCEYPKT